MCNTAVGFAAHTICILYVDNAAQMISTMANLEGEETFEASFLGQADEVVQERICDDELILIKGYERFLYVKLSTLDI